MSASDDAAAATAPRWPSISLSETELERCLSADPPAGTEGVRAAVAVTALTPWTLNIASDAGPRRHLAALGPLAIDYRFEDDRIALQPFERTDLVRRVAAALGEGSASEPSEPVRRATRIAPEVLHGLMGVAVDRDAMMAQLSTASPAFQVALAALERIDVLRRSTLDRPLAMAHLAVLSCGDHGRWAVWERIDAREPWLGGTARVQRVHATRLHELVLETVGDLADPHSDRALFAAAKTPFPSRNPATFHTPADGAAA